MLEGLDQVNWGYERLEPSKIPIWLQALTSEDEQLCTQSFRKLWDRIVPWFDFGNTDPESVTSGLKNDAPLLVVPFLIKLLLVDTIQLKWEVVELLRYLAEYPEAADYLLAQTEENKRYRSRARRVYEAVREGTDVYKRLLNDESQDVRRVAGELLDYLETYTPADGKL